MANWILHVHMAATWAMVGLIWFVQIVHYPLFAVIEQNFSKYEHIHQQRTTWVVAPLMLVELLSAIAMVWHPAFAEIRNWCWVGLVLVAVIWLSTALIQVPQHTALTKAYDMSIITKLVSGNWIRTITWTARGVLALFLFHKFFFTASP